MLISWVRSWIIWGAFSVAGALVGLFAGICAMLLAAWLLSALPLADPSNSLVDFGSMWGGGLVTGLAVGGMQSLALNWLQRGTLVRGLRRWPTLWWIGGTALGGGLIWWVALGSPQDWLFTQWAATPDAGPSAALVLTTTGLGAVLGLLVGGLQSAALIRTPRLALVWIVLHVVLCACALGLSIADLPSYNFVGEHARDRLFSAILNAVFLALGGSVVLGGALLAQIIKPSAPSSRQEGPVAPFLLPR